MATPQEPVYSMSRGSEQVIRVNLIQFVWAETLGYLLHPEIPQNVKKIADVATATGLWLCELNAERTRFQRSDPSTKLNDYELLDGYDISPQSFLPKDQRPSVVTLGVQDAGQVPPPELRGKYDVVHVRCITPGVRDGDPSPIIRHCWDLLRPGGYLQWEEFDTLDYKIVMNDNNASDPPHLQQVVDTFKHGSPKEWVKNLPTTLKSHDFTVLATSRTREPPWHRTTMTHVVCGVIDEISRARMDKVGPPGAGEKLREIVRAGIKENLEGEGYISSLFQVVVARKPE